MSKLPAVVLAMLLLLSCSAGAQPVGWMTNEEPHAPYGDSVWSPYATGDTFVCRVHSNDTIPIFGSPVFYNVVSSHASGFYEGAGFDPVFIGPPPSFGAPIRPIPDVVENLRNFATNYYNPGPDKQMRIELIGSMAYVSTWDWGVAYDPLIAQHEQVNIGSGTCIFTESPLELEGINVSGEVTVGSAQLIRITNDVRVGAPTSGPPDYRVSPDNHDYIGIVSGGDIKIANNTENGRENSAGLGFDQPNQDFTNIAITAAVRCAGSFTSEQQNDPDSAYVCECSPDWRGTVYIYGSVVQGTRGFLSRQALGGSGYRLMMRYDSRFEEQMPPCFFWPAYGGSSTDTLNFGDVIVAQTAIDTAQIYVTEYSTLGMAMANPPFSADPVLPQFGYHFAIPVSFTPPYAGNFNGVLQVNTSYVFFSIVLRGHGVPEGAPPVREPIVYPNPFNSTTTFTFEVSQPGRVTAELFDISGRLVTTLTDETYTAGVHHLPIAGQALASGVYFLHLRTPSRQNTVKLLLLK
jgi:hypothetical protein